jgi:superfamily II DNA or RNA helicase
MSLTFILSRLSIETRELISSELKVNANDESKHGKMGRFFASNQTKPAKWVYPYRLHGDQISLPMAWALKHVPSAARRPRAEFTQTSYKYLATLRKPQIEIKKEALLNLNKRGTIVISAFPGFGKTVTSIALARKTGMRTLVLVNKVILLSQWIDAVEQFTDLKKGRGVVKIAPPSKSQRESESKMEKWRLKSQNASFMVMNALTVGKLPPDFFKDIGCLIVDECHQIMSPCLSEALLYLSPRYTIALSATPYRSDGLDQLLSFYFSKEQLVRELKKKHTVYEIRTGFKPIADQTPQGRLDWNGLLNSQSDNENRNTMIVDAACALSASTSGRPKARTILILTKRVDHAALLESKLKARGVSADGLYGTKKTFDRSATVLVGTSSKIGVGFDHKTLDCLILASDVESYFIQFLGRVFRREDVEPIILDFVDTNPVLRKHFRTRKAVYIKHGGVVITIKGEDKFRQWLEK